MNGQESDHIWDQPFEHADGTPFTPEEMAEELRTLREFVDRHDSAPPGRPPMGDKFSGPVALPGGGHTHETEDEGPGENP